MDGRHLKQRRYGEVGRHTVACMADTLQWFTNELKDQAHLQCRDSRKRGNLIVASREFGTALAR